MSKPNKADLVQKVLKILSAECEDPVEGMRLEAEAMLSIAKALQGQSPADARAIIRAVANLV